MKIRKNSNCVCCISIVHLTVVVFSTVCCYLFNKDDVINNCNMTISFWILQNINIFIYLYDITVVGLSTLTIFTNIFYYKIYKHGISFITVRWKKATSIHELKLSFCLFRYAATFRIIQTPKILANLFFYCKN